ncbi:MAG: hypothetical protein SPE03_05040 [Treponema sp.]|nr:hypothetical protein [Treponema sp.]
MAKTDNLTDFLINTANAIRTAEGSSDAINPQDFEARITALKLSVPIEISTDAGMEAVLTSDNVGKVYKFTGTSDTYTNGDLYVVEVG